MSGFDTACTEARSTDYHQEATACMQQGDLNAFREAHHRPHQEGDATTGNRSTIRSARKRKHCLFTPCHFLSNSIHVILDVERFYGNILILLLTYINLRDQKLSKSLRILQSIHNLIITLKKVNKVKYGVCVGQKPVSGLGSLFLASDSIGPSVNSPPLSLAFKRAHELFAKLLIHHQARSQGVLIFFVNHCL